MPPASTHLSSAPHDLCVDRLTGLATRAGLAERLAELGTRDGGMVRGALLILNLDSFRALNVAYGYAAGDRILQDLADRLRQVTGQWTVLAHLGADEFALFCPGVKDVATAERLSARILTTVTEPFRVSGLRVGVGLSIGVAHSPTHADNPEDLARRADSAMYQVKLAGGRGFAVYDATAAEEKRTRLRLIGDLRDALAKGHLRLHYQPQLDLVSSRLYAVEALARWAHPRLGPIPPTVFVTAAEEAGMAGELAEWALRSAVAQSAQWRGEGINCPVSVNISAALLKDGGLFTTVFETLSQFRLPPGSLTLEITEVSLAEPSETVVAALHELRRLGVSISIDDFGTGYSALSYLKHLPIDELKIDQSFILDMAHSLPDREIVRAVANLGHTLGLRVVAEGIQSDSSLRICRELGCIGQGYLICRPAPAQQIREWFLNRARPVAWLDPRHHESATPASRGAVARRL